jgi:hypothetical protein
MPMPVPRRDDVRASPAHSPGRAVSGSANPVDLASRLVGGEVRLVSLALAQGLGTGVPRVWCIDAEAGAFWLVEDGRFAELYARGPSDYQAWAMGVPCGAIAASTEFRRRRRQREGRPGPRRPRAVEGHHDEPVSP